MTRKKSPHAPARATADSKPADVSSLKATSSPKAASDLTTSEGLDREIAILRDLIHKAAARQNEKLELDEQLELLDTVGKTAPALARLLKARRDLANQDLDPAALLRQALLELEEEWPELKKFGEQFRK